MARKVTYAKQFQCGNRWTYNNYICLLNGLSTESFSKNKISSNLMKNKLNGRNLQQGTVIANA